MNINIISKGIWLSFISSLIIGLLLVLYDFEMNIVVFTLLLLLSVFLVSFHAGKKNERFAQINGFFIGLFSSFLLFIYLSQNVKMNVEINLLISLSWAIVGLFGSALSASLIKKRKLISKK